MKFSIITPTHKITPYLEELYDSLVEQTYEDWEWVVYLNGSADISQIHKHLKSDSRVRIIESRITSKSIGFIKNQAFHAGRGDILVEVDHDDWLHENCLERLAEAFSDDEVGFTYSDTLIYDQVNKDKLFYNKAHGWNHDWIEFRGEKYYAPKHFEPTSRSLCYIWYAPDHVRSWRKSVYEEIGGHNVDLSICDDHELMIRTYLKTKMYHIKKPLYIYRVYGENTYLQRNADIQTKTVDLYKEYAYQLAEKDADDRGLLKVDIGGGLYPRAGYLTVDQEGGDITCDLNEGIPLPDNSVGVINASHVLEHLRDPIKSMREIHRVLAHGGWAMIEVPSTDGRGAWQDPTHVSFWNEHSFWYYTNKDKAIFIRNSDIRFQTYRLETWEMAPHIPVVTAWLTAIKDEERLPGVLGI